jgi:hypothetical protein
MAKIDYKKEYKELYYPETSPSVIEVPPILYFTVEGIGSPDGKRFVESIELLYSLSYRIKMQGKHLEGWFDHVVPPLEGFWLFDGPEVPEDRNEWKWKLLIRQPEYVDQKAFEWGLDVVLKKKPYLEPYTAVLETIDEGLCVQIMHIGPFTTEHESIRKINDFADTDSLRIDIGKARAHHEIYLSDPEKTDPAKMRTVIRLPVIRI